MKLSDGRLYWPAVSPGPPPLQPLRGNARCDVLVVGAGVTGALAAYELSRAGAAVIIVDRRAAVSGSTPASTALVQFEIDRPLIELTRRLGREHACAAYVAAARGVDDLRRLGDELGGGCDIAPRPSLFLAARPRDTELLEHEAGARRDIGLSATLIDRRELLSRFSLDRPGAILSTPALEMNPVKFTRAVLNACESRGVRAFEHTDVDLAGVAGATPPFTLHASTGATISTDWVVLATGYETPEQFSAVAPLTQLRTTFASATVPLGRPPWPERALIWECGDPYFYARTTADHRILMGGEDVDRTEPASSRALIANKSLALEAKLRSLLPHLHTATEFRWAGTFAQTSDGLPYIGRHSRWSNALFALGYGGNGITFSMIAAQIITAAITGTAHESARWFSFDR